MKTSRIVLASILVLGAATMVQGIQAAIKEAIPEVTEVVDATDHTAGENPFYT